MSSQNMTLYSYTFTPRKKGGVYEVVFARGIGEIMFNRPEIFETHRFYPEDKVATHAIPENKVEVYHVPSDKEKSWMYFIHAYLSRARKSCSSCDGNDPRH
ncbi:MAG: hypothetical protein ACXABY_22280 [Candidatus Thorarchaeota archaeon]